MQKLHPEGATPARTITIQHRLKAEPGSETLMWDLRDVPHSMRILLWPDVLDALKATTEDNAEMEEEYVPGTQYTEVSESYDEAIDERDAAQSKVDQAIYDIEHIIASHGNEATSKVMKHLNEILTDLNKKPEY